MQYEVRSMTVRSATEDRLRAVEEAITSEPYEAEEAPLAPWVYVPEACEILGKSPITLQRWRSRGYGPPHSYNGNRVCYRRVDLYEWPLRELEQKQDESAPASPPSQPDTTEDKWWEANK